MSCTHSIACYSSNWDKLTSNKGKVFGPWGGEGGEERRPHRQIRKGVNSRHVYLDGLRGHVVQAQGGACINRLSFNWDIFITRFHGLFFIYLLWHIVICIRLTLSTCLL